MRELGDGGVEGEVAVGAGSAGVDDAFGDALVVERGDLSSMIDAGKNLN